MKRKEENIKDSIAFDVYNNLKKHLYINDVSKENALSFHDEYIKLYKYLVDKEYKKNIPEIELILTETHDINQLYCHVKFYCNDEILKVHHTYMMEILDCLKSLFNDIPKKEFLNIWKYVKFKNEYKWRNYLYKIVKFDNIYKSINCIRESKLDSVINRYKEIVKWETEHNNITSAKLFQDELDDFINRTGLYHIILSDEDFLKYYF